MYLLYETASGYFIFQIDQAEEIGRNLKEVQNSILDLAKFGKHVNVVSFLPFENADEALENINSIAEGILHNTLKTFLELNIPITGKKSNKVVLGGLEKGLAGTIKQTLNINCVTNEVVQELVRGIKHHESKIIRQITEDTLLKSRSGLAHSYSRSKVKFNIHRSDNMIIQAISTCDQMDKDINLFFMRLKEWYSWHFPELFNLVTNTELYTRLTLLIGIKTTIDEKIAKIEELTKDSLLTQRIIDSAKSSMGADLSNLDVLNINHFAKRLINLIEYRKGLGCYMTKKMNTVAPNLSALIGETVGARLIAHSGSLTNLSKFPASTVQILGAEKALFRALKTRGKTPKYGLIYHSSFIGRAAVKNKGRISRYLANKCTIASRLDAYSDVPDPDFGIAMRNQVEQRLNFFETGELPPSNSDIMKAVIEAKRESLETKKTDAKTKIKKKSKTEKTTKDKSKIKAKEIKKKTKKSKQ